MSLANGTTIRFADGGNSERHLFSLAISGQAMA